MRGVGVVLGLLGLSLVVGCGADPDAERRDTAPTTGTYELDVIAEAEPDEGPPPLTVRFSGYVDEETGAPWRFDWDFGDGTTADSQRATHTFEREGDYTVVLTVTDRRGNTGTDEIDVFVETED